MNLDDYFLLRKRGARWFVSHEYANGSFHVPNEITTDTPNFNTRTEAIEFANAIEDANEPSDYGIIFEEDLDDMLDLKREDQAAHEAVIRKIRES